MKRVGKIAVCIAGGLVLAAGVRAQNTAAPGDPYAAVVTRNIFGLNPPPPPAPPTPDTPPPKITPNGIISIFGQLQVLFKVAMPPKPGAPAAGEPSYILSEGQRQDEIEVVKIDERNSIVTFKNHGETQQLPLVATAPSSTAAAGPAIAGAPGGPNGGNFGNPGNGGGGAGNAGIAGGNYGNGAGGPGNYGNQNGGVNPGGAVPRRATANAADQIPAGMTEEVQTIAIEAGRLQAKQQGEPDIFPITELTEQQNTDGGATKPQ